MALGWRRWIFGLEWLVLVPRLLAWQAWHFETSTFHVAGVALGDIDCHFVWQEWHVWHWRTTLAICRALEQRFPMASESNVRQ